MDLLSIEYINSEYLFYTDLRSVKKWLSAKGLNIIRLGKKYFVQKNAFENLLKNITGIEYIETRGLKAQKLNPDEEKIFNSLKRSVQKSGREI